MLRLEIIGIISSGIFSDKNLVQINVLIINIVKQKYLILSAYN